MARWLAVAVAVVAFFGLAAGAAGGMATKTKGAPGRGWIPVEDKLVMPKTLIASQAIMEIRNLKFWDAILEDTGAQCTVVSGELLNMTDVEGWKVALEIEIWTGSWRVNHIGTAKMTIDNPGKKVPVPFRLLLPACYDAGNWKNGCRLHYTTRLTIQ